MWNRERAPEVKDCEWRRDPEAKRVKTPSHVARAHRLLTIRLSPSCWDNFPRSRTRASYTMFLFLNFADARENWTVYSSFFPSLVDKVMQRRRRWCRGWYMISSLFMVRLRRRYWDAVICYRGWCGLSCRERRPRCALVHVSFRAFAQQLLHFLSKKPCF